VGTIDDNIDSLFGKIVDETYDAKNTEILSDESDGNADCEAWISDNEKQRPFGHYLAKASNLDVKQLQ
jgi:hypothetical protein